MIRGNESKYRVMALRLGPGAAAGKVKLAESIWKQFVPGSPFQYSFIEQNFDATFHAEDRMGNIFMVFTFMAIFIACLGLVGLVTYRGEQRTKEIGIRRV